MNFDAFVKDIQQNKMNVFGAEVYEDGVLTHAYGDTDENLHEIFSATKTILSIAVGIAVDENSLIFEASSVTAKTNTNGGIKNAELKNRTQVTVENTVNGNGQRYIRNKGRCQYINNKQQYSYGNCKRRRADSC